MKSILRLMCLLYVASLFGCAGETFPLTDTEVNKMGDTVDKVAGYTKDASVAKEHEVHATLRNRDKQYAQAYAQSGFQVEFDFVEVAPGIKVQLMKKVAFKETPRFEQQLPIAPSIHPVWGTMEKLGSAAIQWTGIGFLTNIFAGVMNEGWKHTAPQYNGPYNPVFDSYNQTAQPYFAPVTPWEIH